MWARCDAQRYEPLTLPAYPGINDDNAGGAPGQELARVSFDAMATA
jgi:hypothetical protein